MDAGLGGGSMGDRDRNWPTAAQRGALDGSLSDGGLCQADVDLAIWLDAEWPHGGLLGYRLIQQRLVLVTQMFRSLRCAVFDLLPFEF